MKKIIIINAGPRKNGNTAQLLKEAQKGAESAGAETEYIDLYDLNFTGCRSCLACKRRGAERNKCYWQDDLSPVIDKILKSDGVIIGSPIYMGGYTSNFWALYERLGFCVLSYDGEHTYFNGRVNVGMIYTMNAAQSYYENTLRPRLKMPEYFLGVLLKGKVLNCAACDTMQVQDYSQYNMGMFAEAHKKEVHAKQFPIDLKNSFELGKNIVE